MPFPLNNLYCVFSIGENFPLLFLFSPSRLFPSFSSPFREFFPHLVSHFHVSSLVSSPLDSHRRAPPPPPLPPPSCKVLMKFLQKSATSDRDLGKSARAGKKGRESAPLCACFVVVGRWRVALLRFKRPKIRHERTALPKIRHPRAALKFWLAHFHDI